MMVAMIRFERLVVDAEDQRSVIEERRGSLEARSPGLLLEKSARVFLPDPI